MSKLLAHSTENTERTADVIIEETTLFESLLLPEKVLTGLQKNGFVKPSPIQLKAIPVGRCGFDLIVKSKSGTGKTLIFTIIALENIDVKKEKVQVLIVAPAREIAVQICDVIKQIGCCIEGLTVQSFIGGLSLAEDKEKCINCHIAVGTPGRLKHLMNEKLLTLDSVRLFVLDEVDKLTERTFISDINEIYNNLPRKKQIITTSATYPEELQDFLSQYMLSPTFINSEVHSPLLLGLKQFVKIVAPVSNIIQQTKVKFDILNDILSAISFTQCLIFSNYQSRAESISNFLNQKGWSSTFISAAQAQKDRLKALNSLKKFKCRIMLSTDLTARGVDAANVDLVINYDIPVEAMTYLHRMGRAGRFGSFGVCINLAFEGKELLHLQNILGCIGGTALCIPLLPDHIGTLTDLLKIDIPQDQYVTAVVSDKMEENIRRKIIELKTNKYEESISKIKKDKGNKSKSKSQAKDLIEDDILNILDDTNEMEKFKKQVYHMETNDILDSLASGTFDFNKSDHETKVVEQNECSQSCTLLDNLKADSSNSSKMETIKNLLISNSEKVNVDTTVSEAESSIHEPTDKKQELLCKNKALLGVSKNLDCSSRSTIGDASLTAYLNMMKRQEKEAVSNLVKGELLDTLDQLENTINSEEVSTLENGSLTSHDLSHLETSSNIDEIGTSLSTDKGSLRKYDLESIFQLGYESIVKSDSQDWKNWLSSRQNDVIETDDIDEDYYENDDDIDANENEVEIMKWVPVTKTNRTRQNVAQNDEGTSRDIHTSLPGHAEMPIQQACVLEANRVDDFEHLYGYFDNCSNHLWQTGISFESVQSFDEWFAYEWEAQLFSVRNYVQQNMYIQEMSKYGNTHGSQSGAYTS